MYIFKKTLSFKFTSEIISLQKYLFGGLFQPLQSLFISLRLISPNPAPGFIYFLQRLCIIWLILPTTGKYYFSFIILQVIQNLTDSFSHVKSVFLAKNSTSKLEPLNFGTIKKIKVFCRKQLLQHLLARIKLGSKASCVRNNVDLLKSIGWVTDAWRKVKKRDHCQLFF